MTQHQRTSRCGRHEAGVRLRAALAYVEVAELVLEEGDREEHLSVSAGLAVLAGIAASDALCCLLLHERSRGPDHRSAAQLLEKATRDGKRLAACLSRLIDLKDEAHYGVILVSTRKARDAVQRARTLVDRASEELSR